MPLQFDDGSYTAPAGTPPMGGGYNPSIGKSQQAGGGIYGGGASSVPNSPRPQTQWNRPMTAPTRNMFGTSGIGRRLASGYQQKYNTEMTRRDRASSAYGGTGQREANVGPLGGFDPNRPGEQYTADGKGDMGANNGFNQANFWDRYQTAMNQTGGDWMQGRERAAGSRANADSWRGSYQAPNYQAPADFSFGGQRAPMMSDEDFASSFNRYNALMGQTGGPIQSRDAEATDTGGFGSAFYNYANAGANILQTRMKDANRQLTDNAAGRGRLNTGFFDEDKGELWRTLGREAQDEINSKALDAARLDMEPAMQNARLRTQVSEGNADRNLQGQRYGQDDRQFLMDFTAGREDTRGERGDRRYESDRDFAFDAYRDRRNFGRDVFEGDRGFGRDVFESDRGFDEDRYRFDEDMSRNDRDAYMDMVTGGRDWRNAQQQQDRANSGSFLKGLGQLGLGLAGSALGPIGAAAGQYVGGKIFGGGGGGGQGGGHGGDQGGGRPSTSKRW